MVDQTKPEWERFLTSRSMPSTMRFLQAPVELTGGWASTSVYGCVLSVDQPVVGSTCRAVLKLYGPDVDGVEHATREWRALRHLAGTSCPVPQVLAFEPDPGVTGRPFLLMERIDGPSWWSAYEAAAEVDRRAELVRTFVRPLVELHAMDASQLDPAAARTSDGSIDGELAALSIDVREYPRSGLAEVVRWLTDHRDAVPGGRPVILHRDYHPWNTIIDARDTVWVLDWDWQIGDPRFDLAWTRTLLQRSGHRAVADAVRDEYADRSGLELDGLPYFEVLTTARWLLNVLPAIGADSRLDARKRADFRTFLQNPFRQARDLLLDHTGLEAHLDG